MPWINKPKKKKRQKYGKNLEISKIYSSQQWRDLRSWYFQRNPLCEYCLKLGITKEGSEVHHLTEISKGNTIEQMKLLAYNPNNLITLCTEHHHDVHNNKINLNDFEL